MLNRLFFSVNFKDIQLSVGDQAVAAVSYWVDKPAGPVCRDKVGKSGSDFSKAARTPHSGRLRQNRGFSENRKLTKIQKLSEKRRQTSLKKYFYFLEIRLGPMLSERIRESFFVWIFYSENLTANEFQNTTVNLSSLVFIFSYSFDH